MKKVLLLLIMASLISCSQEKDQFELCGMGISKPYYVTGLKYNGEIYKIETTIKEQYIPVKTNNNGIVKIRFKVNCKGQIGDLHHEEYDMDYIKTPLNDSIKSQLLKSVSNLSDWIPGVNDGGEPINSHSFLSFRIANGEIIEILPK